MIIKCLFFWLWGSLFLFCENDFTLIFSDVFSFYSPIDKPSDSLSIGNGDNSQQVRFWFCIASFIFHSLKWHSMQVNFLGGGKYFKYGNNLKILVVGILKSVIISPPFLMTQNYPYDHMFYCTVWQYISVLRIYWYYWSLWPYSKMVSD